MSGKSGREKPRLTFENTVSKILEEGHVKSISILRRTCMKKLVTEYVETVEFGASFSLTTPLGIHCKAKG